MIKAKTPWYLRIVFFVKNLTSASMELLLNREASVVAALKGPVSVADVNLAIRQQLRKDFEDLGVDAVLLHPNNDPTNKLHDVIIAGDQTRKAHVG